MLIPSAYAAINQPKNCRHKEIADPYRWNATTIGYILDRQEYLGHTVLGKSICENFKTKQRRAATPDELMIFPDTHEAIIDQDTWDIARKIRSKKPRVANGTYSHRLSGLVYCVDCGSQIGFISPEANHSEKHYDSDSAFQCGNYRSKSGECVSHYVKTSVLEAAILQAIQAVSKYVLENEDEFIQQLKAVWNEQQTRTANNGYQKLAEAKKRMAELDEEINKLYESTIGGFNSMIEQQKKAEGEALISTVLFDNVSEVLHDRVNVRDIRPMTDRDYTVRGCTALLDAIGGAIHHIGNVHKYARPEDVPEHTMFVITTDGMENASRRYNSEKVKQMIERQKAKYGWEFLFLGANIDAVETASQFGIGADRAVNYQCDSEGTALNYEVVSEAISSVRCSAPLSADWKKRIDEDYKKRGGRKHK